MEEKTNMETNETMWEVQLGADISEYKTSDEWDLMSVVSTRHKKSSEIGSMSVPGFIKSPIIFNF